MADVRLYNGDCLSILRDIQTASVDAIITDPPYSTLPGSAPETYSAT